MMHKKIHLTAALLSVIFYTAHAREMILEGRGAYLRSSDSTFRDIYHNGGGIYGAQAVIQLYKHLYGFASTDFFNKKGSSIGLCTPTRVNIINVGLGLEYMVPCCDSIDFYAGLGIAPTQLRTVDDSPYVVCKQKKWGCGGVAKLGFYFTIPEQPFILDFFADYAFVKISFDGRTDPLERGCTANLNSGRFGVGFGYKFN